MQFELFLSGVFFSPVFALKNYRCWHLYLDFFQFGKVKSLNYSVLGTGATMQNYNKPCTVHRVVVCQNGTEDSQQY